MAIAKLNLVSLDFDKDNCNDVLLELYQRDDFHPELASKFTDSVAGLSAYNNDNLYEELFTRIEEMKNKNIILKFLKLKQIRNLMYLELKNF